MYIWEFPLLQARKIVFVGKIKHGTFMDHVELFENADSLVLTQYLLNKNLWK